MAERGRRPLARHGGDVVCPRVGDMLWCRLIIRNLWRPCGGFRCRRRGGGVVLVCVFSLGGTLQSRSAHATSSSSGVAHAGTAGRVVLAVATSFSAMNARAARRGVARRGIRAFGGLRAPYTAALAVAVCVLSLGSTLWL